MIVISTSRPGIRHVLQSNWLILGFCRYCYDMSVEEAAELARRAIYHATFRDGASGGVASGMVTLLPGLIWPSLGQSCTSAWSFSFVISLSCWTRRMEEVIRRWCRWTSLQVLPRYAKHSRAGNGWGSSVINRLWTSVKFGVVILFALVIEKGQIPRHAFNFFCILHRDISDAEML